MKKKINKKKKKCKCRYEGCCYVPVKECPIHGDIVRGLENLNKEIWEEEFESNIFLDYDVISEKYILKIPKYEYGTIHSLICNKIDIRRNGRGTKKVKIKARKGKIVIERIK